MDDVNEPRPFWLNITDEEIFFLVAYAGLFFSLGMAFGALILSRW